MAEGRKSCVQDDDMLKCRNLLMLGCGLDKAILVPLTTSLYVPGTLADNENVIVDIGTGFYVEKVRRFVHHMGIGGGVADGACRVPRMLRSSMMQRSRSWEIV